MVISVARSKGGVDSKEVVNRREVLDNWATVKWKVGRNRYGIEVDRW